MEGSVACRKAFWTAMGELHLTAGEPSTRAIAKECGVGTLSHTTVRQVLRGPRMAKLHYVTAVVRQLEGNIERYHALWVDARKEEVENGPIGKDGDVSDKNATGRRSEEAEVIATSPRPVRAVEVYDRQSSVEAVVRGAGVSSSLPLPSSGNNQLVRKQASAAIDHVTGFDPAASASSSAPKVRVRMTGRERRLQLMRVGRELFATKGFEGTSIEEVAARALVSKPVVYEHFGGREGLFAVILDQEVRTLTELLRSAILTPSGTLEEAIYGFFEALCDYIDQEPDGFEVLTQETVLANPYGGLGSVVLDVESAIEALLLHHIVDPSDKSTLLTHTAALLGVGFYVGAYWKRNKHCSLPQLKADMITLVTSRLDVLYSR